MKVRELLKQRDLRPDKALGQSFLVDPVILQRIAAAAELTEEDLVLEIGAGTGALTRYLAEDAGHVIAVELDRELVEILRNELAEFDNVGLVQGDILALDPATLIGQARETLGISRASYKVVGNLPYYITSAILRHLLEKERRPRLMVVTVQYEVARRIVASPGDMSLLAVSVQFFGEPELLFRIQRGSFYPRPAVDSAVVRIEMRRSPPLPPDEAKLFFDVARAGFSQRRKQLHNALAAGVGDRLSRDEAVRRLEEVGIDHRRRAQTLSVAEWIAITEKLRGVIESS